MKIMKGWRNQKSSNSHGKRFLFPKTLLNGGRRIIKGGYISTG